MSKLLQPTCLVLLPRVPPAHQGLGCVSTCLFPAGVRDGKEPGLAVRSQVWALHCTGVISTQHRWGLYWRWRDHRIVSVPQIIKHTLCWDCFPNKLLELKPLSWQTLQLQNTSLCLFACGLAKQMNPSRIASNVKVLTQTHPRLDMHFYRGAAPQSKLIVLQCK